MYEDSDYYYLIIYENKEYDWKSIMQGHRDISTEKALMLKLLRRELKEVKTQAYKDKIKTLITKLEQ